MRVFLESMKKSSALNTIMMIYARHYRVVSGLSKLAFPWNSQCFWFYSTHTLFRPIDGENGKCLCCLVTTRRFIIRPKDHDLSVFALLLFVRFAFQKSLFYGMRLPGIVVRSNRQEMGKAGAAADTANVDLKC